MKKEKINLLNTTLIIPIKVEHPDRMRNAMTTLGFINQHFNTNVFIYEISDDGLSRLDFLDNLNNLNIKHWCVKEDGSFHRTKYLNIMLDDVETSVVANYDIDVMFRPDVYSYCQNRIINSDTDVIYPYERGSKGQLQINQNFNYKGFQDSEFSADFLNNEDPMTAYDAECGHCIFFNTETYRRFGGENENFISYGPEDKERMIRFQKLTNNKVEWIKNIKVYHLEHYRSHDSSSTNPHFLKNWEIFNLVSSADPESLLRYYENQEYRNNYKNLKVPHP